MKDRTFFNWLIILLGVIAITSFCFTPAFADDTGDDMEIQDDSFGLGYQYTWIPIESFTPVNNLTAYSIDNGYAWFSSLQSPYLKASINLPSGAYVVMAQFNYYDNASGHANCTISRFEYPNSNTLLASFFSSGTPGSALYYLPLQHTIVNATGTYRVVIGTNQNTNQVKVGGVRLMWKRQVRTGLSNPFDDIGWMPAIFQDSIAALYASGITSGTTSTTYSPNDPVTRGQMAVFLAKALGLHWDFPY